MHQYALVYYINCVCIVCIESIVCIVWIVCISLLHAFVNFLSSNFECTKEKGNFNTYQFAIFQSASLVILVWALYICRKKRGFIFLADKDNFLQEQWASCHIFRSGNVSVGSILKSSVRMKKFRHSIKVRNWNLRIEIGVFSKSQIGGEWRLRFYLKLGGGWLPPILLPFLHFPFLWFFLSHL